MAAAYYHHWTLPMPVVGFPTTASSLASIFLKSFGGNPNNSTSYWLTYSAPQELSAWNFSYWRPATPYVSKWFVSGHDIGPTLSNQTFITNGGVAATTFQLGNDIGPLAWILIPAAGTPGAYASYVQYSVITIEPELMSPVAGHGAPKPADIVATARRFAAHYGAVPNVNDCHFIASAVAAATGATLTDNTQDLNSNHNEEHGFWRIAYRGTNANRPDWEALVQPGDIVRMGWKAGGFHTIVVLARNNDGTLTVYDNTLPSAQGPCIGIHAADFDGRTIASTVTIYRLTTDGYYSILGHSIIGETLAGTVFNDDMAGFGGNDTLNGGPGNDRLEGGVGIDTLNGGPGNDIYVLNLDPGDSSTDKIIDASGIDTIWSGFSRSLSGYPMIENLVMFGGTTGFGNNLANRIEGNAAANALNGGAGNDTLVSLGGNDRLLGGPGNDRLIGGLGIDTLTGGADSDLFVFDKAPNVATNRDVITDFNHAADTIQLDHRAFTQLGGAGPLKAGLFFAGTAAHQLDDRVIYDQAHGNLFYDSNGNLPGGSVLIATLTHRPALAANDFVVI